MAGAEVESSLRIHRVLDLSFGRTARVRRGTDRPHRGSGHGSLERSVPGATVTVTNEGTNEVRKFTTEGTGDSPFRYFPPAFTRFAWTRLDFSPLSRRA